MHLTRQLKNAWREKKNKLMELNKEIDNSTIIAILY